MKARIPAAVLVLAFALGALALPAVAHLAVCAASWTDTFDGPTLDSRWFWLNEDPTHWSLTARPGFMRIIAQTGMNNFLLQAEPAGDYIVETRVLFEPAYNIQRAGLVLIEDGENSLWLMRAFCSYGPPGCPGNAIYFDHGEGGVPVGGNFAMTTTSTDEAYLRIVRHGRAYTGYVSEDGVHWTLVGTHITGAGFAPVGVGVAANYTPLDAGEIPADFDYFTWTELPQRLYLPLIMR
jgi:beta-xylosidase